MSKEPKKGFFKEKIKALFEYLKILCLFLAGLATGIVGFSLREDIYTNKIVQGWAIVNIICIISDLMLIYITVNKINYYFNELKKL